MNKSVAVPYVITTIDSNDIIGYYTLSSMSIAATGMPEEAVRRLPRYPILPSILIGRLARNINQKGNRIGEFLLIDALKRSLEISTQLGSVAVVVDAISEKAVVFYRGYGFTQFKDNNRRLFLTMATIQELNL